MPTNNIDSYNVVFNAINDAVFIHDAESGAILKVNEAMLTMYGYSHDEISTLTIDDVSAGEPPYDQSHGLERIRNVLAGEPQLFEWHAKKKNGQKFWVEVSLSLASLSDSRRVLAVVRDITQRKKTEQLHKETKQLLEFTKFTVNQAKIAVFWCHANGFFFYVNDTSCEWLQYSREELMSMHVADINPEFPREAWESHWQEIKTHGLVTMQSVHRRKNGEIYPVEIYSNYVRFEGKEYKLAFVHDISAQKLAEEEKVALEDRLRQAQKMEAIGTLAGGVAHDLNNMLSPILGYTELLQRGVNQNDRRWAKLNEIYKAGLRARNLTRQLLSFGRKQPLTIKTIDLNEVIEGFERMLHRTIRENVVIQKQLAESLPPIDGDVGQVEQIILNLAINAQDAMPHGGTLTIETDVVHLDEKFPEFSIDDKPGPYVMLSVSDTGDGMDKETLARIFDPFFTTKEMGQGTGLGLSTVYGIVKQHRGYLWPNSELGQGATFNVYFPQSIREIKAPDLPKMAIEPAKGDETILVVEDQEQVLMLAKHILNSCGYRVLCADGPGSALEIVQNTQAAIDLLLTDVVMPELNGKALYEKLVEQLPHLKVLYMSGYTEKVIMNTGIVGKDINFISKPFVVADLAAKVREVLDG